MLGLYVPVGADPAVVEALERFAEYVVAAVQSEAITQSGYGAEPGEDQWADDMAEAIGGSLRDFLREGIGAGVAAGGAMALDDRLMALADNGAHKHRQVAPRQPKRYDTKILPGRWG